MNIVEKSEVHFHEQERLSVYLESNSSCELEKVGEIGLLTMFALRMLSNLGKSQEADGLAQALCRAEDIVPLFATGQATGGFELIPYPGYEGRKRFYATFLLRDDELRLDMTPKGFGLLGTGLRYYAPVAVLGMLRHLAMKRATDGAYLQRLATAASFCGTHTRGEKSALPTRLNLVAHTSLQPVASISTRKRNNRAPCRRAPGTLPLSLGHSLKGRFVREIGVRRATSCPIRWT